MSDRHDKWTRVEPGTVIPAGQPYRIEWHDDDLRYGTDYKPNDHDFTIRESRAKAWFIDSSWKPPLVLPTEPTWGIAVCPKPKGMDSVHDEPFAMVGRWARYDSDILTRTHRDFQTGFDTLDVSFLLDFIEFTPEQIARLEQNL